MKKRFVFMLACSSLSGMVMAQQAPFCVVTGYGQQQCFYYNLDACRSAARTFNGMCIANAAQQPVVQQQVVVPQYQPLQPRQSNILDMARHVQEQGDAGRRAAQQQIEHRARVDLMQAQTNALAAQTEGENAPSQGEYYRAIYLCGETHTPVPAPGCVVVYVYP